MLENSFLSIGSEDGRTTCDFCINTRYFRGLIDEVGVYNRALTPQEISDIYNCTKFKNQQPFNISPERAYVCSGNMVEVLDLPTLEFIDQIEIPNGGARMIEIVKGKKIACITHNFGVSKIDLNTNTVVATIDFPDNQQTCDVAVTPDGKTALVTLYYTNAVAAIDIDTWTLLKIIPLKNMDYPNGIEIGNGGQYAFVANQYSGRLQVIDVKKLIVYKEFETNTDGINELILESGGQNIYCTAYNQKKIVVIDSKNISVLKYIDLPYNPRGIDITKNGKTALACGAGTIGMIDTKTLAVIKVMKHYGGSRIRINSNDKLAIISRSGFKQIMILNLEDFSIMSILNVEGNLPFGVDFLTGLK